MDDGADGAVGARFVVPGPAWSCIYIRSQWGGGKMVALGDACGDVFGRVLPWFLFLFLFFVLFRCIWVGFLMEMGDIRD